ncbi:CpaE family protein [Pseudoduganella plicata]|uniref:CobQ/CobB/MinD/ParA nucleotide binding domain-containing protein n=1 Tax=Pseudoduganella plicata TaxID=321984 RepID=A0A4P7BFK8_9BURK|nr:AAA family ATPase [Pseudoduganella plicata]QBQ37541.1 CobQ/CobB/MinD/ParA nucleotide binding domain-containing protein [Pseudoduganella plicata]GGY91119.1 pilus assembly-related protein [Pseudoduganella plicata]
MKIAILSRDDRQLIELARVLRNRPGADEVDMIAGTPAKLTTLADDAVPDVLVVDQPRADEGELEALERLGHLFPRMSFIVLAGDLSQDFLLRAMRAGVREVLPAIPAPAALAQALDRIAEKLGNQGGTNGKVLAFISCKGGSGSTFLATNLAYALSAGGSKRVALIDMNLQFGDASLFVSDIKPLATLSDVATQIHRLDPSFLASSMVAVTPNYSVLAAPSDPAHASDVKPEHIDAIVKLARRQYDFIVLDVGRSLDPVSIRALDHADTIYPVLQMTLPYIRDGKRLLTVFRNLDYAKDKVELIVNRHDKNSDIRLRDLEEAFDTTSLRTMPNHYDAAAKSVNQGVPVTRLMPDSPLSTALTDMARDLTGEAAPQQASSLMARLFKRRAA